MMKAFGSIVAVLLCAFLAVDASAGTITGTITDSSGTPLKGVFVRIHNVATKMTIHVLSDREGQYRADSVPSGTYRVQATSPGYTSEPRTGVEISDGPPTSLNFTAERRPVRWNEISMHQFIVLAPEDPGKQLLTGRCFSCHGHQTQMASVRRDFNGWFGTVQYMRDVDAGMGGFLGASFTDEMAQTVAAYMDKLFGENPIIPASPEGMPGYGATVHGEFTDEAMNIVYVDYELPGPGRFPWSGVPAPDGQIVVPYYGAANRIAKLNPETGVVQEFRVPSNVAAGIHSAVPGPDGTVWFTEQYPNNIGKYDANTGMFAEYPSPGRGRHTAIVDPEGNIWSTGGPLARFNPRTEEFSPITEVPSSYGVDVDREGNTWYTVFGGSEIGKVNRSTLEVTKYPLPTPSSRPRRLEASAPDGAIWIGSYGAGKITRLDPATGTFREWQLPGPNPSPYAFGFDEDGNVWYSSEYQDVYGRLNPQTGEIVEFPFPYSENSSREFFRDGEGRMWWGSPPNNKVGYFYLADR